MADPGGLVEDDLLRLVLMCTHPALAPEAASALALRLVLGVSTADIARLFLVPRADRWPRGSPAPRSKIVAAGIPFAVPAADVLPERLDTVAQTAYLAFTAGYAPGSGPGPAARRTSPARRSGWSASCSPCARTSRRRGAARADAAAALAARRPRRRRRPAGPARRPGPLAGGAATRSTRRCDCSPAPASPGRSARSRRRTSSRPASPPSTPPPLRPEDTRWDRIVDHYDLLLRAVPLPERPARPSGRRRRGVRPRGRPRRARRDRGRSAATASPPSARSCCPAAAMSPRPNTAYDEAIAVCRNDAERAHLVEQQRALAKR